MTIVVNPAVTPTFTQVSPICPRATLAALPIRSNNGINGTWSPAINNLATTTYTFTPTAGQCASTCTMTIVVNPIPPRPTTACYETATFNATLCQWVVTGTQPAAPSVSFIDNCNGTWTITTSGCIGNLLWNTGATTPSITVSSIGVYFVKQIINGCESPITNISVYSTCFPGNGDIYSETNCSNYKENPSRRLINNLCYSVRNNRIKTVTPEIFFYYTSIVAPSSNFTIKVTQAKASSSSANQYRLMSIYNQNQIVLWNPNCSKKSDAGIRSGSNNSQGSLTINNAVAGATYVLSVKYNPESIEGDVFTGSIPPVVNYSFAVSVDNLNDGIANNYNLIPSSQTNIDLVYGCSTTTTITRTSSFDPLMTSSFEVYPVPFIDELFVKYDNIGDETNALIEIFDIRGALLQKEYDTKAYSGKEIKLNTNFLQQSGQIYFIRFTTNKGSEMKKIISTHE
jgi:hypothetical protein